MKALLTYTSTTGSCSEREGEDLKKELGDKIKITKSDDKWLGGTYTGGKYAGEKCTYQYDRLDWHPKVIEINTLEELIKLKNEVGSEIIISNGGMGKSAISTVLKYSDLDDDTDLDGVEFEIEVYNHYRE